MKKVGVLVLTFAITDFVLEHQEGSRILEYMFFQNIFLYMENIQIEKRIASVLFYIIFPYFYRPLS